MSRDKRDTETNQVKKLEKEKKQKQTQRWRKKEEKPSNRYRCRDSERDHPRDLNRYEHGVES
jgi:hypothetical protein